MFGKVPQQTMRMFWLDRKFIKLMEFMLLEWLMQGNSFGI